MCPLALYVATETGEENILQRAPERHRFSIQFIFRCSHGLYHLELVITGVSVHCLKEKADDLNKFIFRCEHCEETVLELID